MSITVAATKRWFNDTKHGNTTLVEAFVITFLYEFLTKDDDDVASTRLNSLIAAYAESPVFQDKLTITNAAGERSPKGFKKTEMGALRAAIKGNLGFVDNGAYGTILEACRYMTTDPVGRQHFYNLIYNAEEIVFQSDDPQNEAKPINTKGRINDATYKDSTWKMPAVGDDGSTDVQKVDWSLFISLVNSTAILSKGALDATIAEDLLSVAANQDYDTHAAAFGRFFGNPQTSPQYNTIGTATRRVTKGSNGQIMNQRTLGATRYIAIQYPLQGRNSATFGADLGQSSYSGTALWNVVKESDSSTEDSNGVPWILTVEAVELFDWSVITGKLLDGPNGVQYWNPEKRPISALDANAFRVVGDESGATQAGPTGGMTRVLKEGFKVEGRFRYNAPENSSPGILQMAGLGFRPADDEKPQEIWAGGNPNLRFKSIVGPGGTDGWKTYSTMGVTKTYKWGDGSFDGKPIKIFGSEVIPKLNSFFEPGSISNDWFGGKEHDVARGAPGGIAGTTVDVTALLRTTGEIKFADLTEAAGRWTSGYQGVEATTGKWSNSRKYGQTAYYLAYNDSYNEHNFEASGLAAVSVYTSRIVARIARCYPATIDKLLIEVILALLDEEEADATNRDKKPLAAAQHQPDVEVKGLKPYDLQCFLIQNIRNLTAAKDAEIQQRIKDGHGAYENLSLIVDIKNHEVTGHPSTGYVSSPARGVQPGNIVSYIHHGGADQTQKVSSLLSLCPDAYAVLQPHIKIYRVDYKGDDTLVPYKEMEIPFPTFIDPKDIDQITNGNLGRYGGAGIKSFTWKLDGVNPAEVENNITATLSLRFQTLQDLFSLNQSLSAGGDAPGYLDLIIGSGTSFRQSPLDPPGANPRNNGAGCTEKFASETYDGARFRIKVAVGWSTPPGFANMGFRDFQKVMPGSSQTYGEFLEQAIEETRTGLYLQVAGHDLNFNEDGGVDLNVRYQASLDGILKAPNADIFVGGTEFDETLKELRTALKESDKVDLEYVESNQDNVSSIDRLAAKREKKLEKMSKLTTKNKALKYKRFLCNLYDKSQIYMLRVPVSELQRMENLTPKQRADMANNRLDPAGNYVDVSAQPQRASETDIGRLITGAESAVNAAVKDRENISTARGVNRSVIGSLKKSGRDVLQPDFLDVPYFYLGDLIDGVLTYLRNIVDTGSGLDGSFQMLLSNIEILDPILAFKYPEVSVRCGGTDGQLIQRALADIDPLRFKNSHLLSFYTNIGSLPVSLEYFQEWFVNNIVRPQRETYSFINFVKQICTSLIGRAFNSKCFGDALNFNIRFDTANFALDKSFTSQIVSPEEVAQSKFRASKHAATAFHRDNGSTPIIPSLVLYSPDSRPSVSKSEIENIQNGIYTHYIGGSCGLSKKISFHKTDMPYIREARLQRKGSLSALQLRELYNVNIDMVGNTLHRNGQYIKVDPTAIGVGSVSSAGSIANVAQLLGIGGYYLVSSVTHTISRSGFDVKVSALQEGIDLDEGTLVAIHEFESKKGNPKSDPDK